MFKMSVYWFCCHLIMLSYFSVNTQKDSTVHLGKVVPHIEAR